MNRSQSSCSQVPAFPDFRAVRMCVHRSGMAIRSYRKRSMLRVCKCVTHTQTHTDKSRVGKRERQVRRISESLSDSCAQRPLTPTWRPPNHPLGTRMGPEGRSLDSKGEGRSLCLKWRPIKAIKTTRNSLLFFNNFLQRFFKDSFIHFAGEEGELEGGGGGDGGGAGFFHRSTKCSVKRRRNPEHAKILDGFSAAGKGRGRSLWVKWAGPRSAKMASYKNNKRAEKNLSIFSSFPICIWQRCQL